MPEVLELTPLVDSMPTLEDTAALRARAEEEGYLYFKGLLPRDSVLGLRRQMLELLAAAGLLDPGAELMDGVANTEHLATLPAEYFGACGTGVPDELYLEVQKLVAFHRLANHARLKELYGRLWGEEVFVHPRHIARLMLPTPHHHFTPPHQDFIHIQGTRNVWTCWAPLGDVPVELGGLAILKGSHKEGLLPVKAAHGAGGLEAWLCSVPYEWVGGAYEAGDVITFPSLTVHRSMPQQWPDRVRLSCDYRYQPLSKPIEVASLVPHCGFAHWEHIYRDWPKSERDLMYYWKDLDLTYAEWDESIRWQKEKIC